MGWLGCLPSNKSFHVKILLLEKQELIQEIQVYILYRETETKVSNRNVQEVAVYTRTTVVIAGWHLQNAAF